MNTCYISESNSNSKKEICLICKQVENAWTSFQSAQWQCAALAGGGATLRYKQHFHFHRIKRTLNSRNSMMENICSFENVTL